MGLPRLLAFRWGLFSLSCRGRRRAVFSFLFFRLLLARFFQRCLERVINHCSVRWILSALSAATAKAAAESGVVGCARRVEVDFFIRYFRLVLLQRRKI